MVIGLHVIRDLYVRTFHTSRLDLKATNFPPDFVAVFTGHASEMSRQCVQPPVRRKARLMNIITFQDVKQ